MPPEDSKGVEDEECLGSMLQSQKKKKTIQNGKPRNAPAPASQPRASRTLNNNSKAKKESSDDDELSIKARRPSKVSKEEDEDEDEDEDSKPIPRRAPASRTNSSSKVKKEEPQSSDDDDLPIKSRRPSKVPKYEDEDEDQDSKPLSRKAPASSSRVIKGKKELSSKKKEKTKEPSTPLQNGKKRERKVYGLPGQKRDPPEERDPLRIFYETLYQQVPDSEMAQFWMMESGLLAKEVAQKIFERKQKNPRLCSPMRATPASKKSQSTSTKKKKMAASPLPLTKTKKAAPKQATNRKLDNSDEDYDSDEDFQMKRTTKKQRAS